MAYYRFEVPGGEFVLHSNSHWQITFNGVQIGGLHRTLEEALHAITKRRAGQAVGPNLVGIEPPPGDLRHWMSESHP